MDNEKIQLLTDKLLNKINQERGYNSANIISLFPELQDNKDFVINVCNTVKNNKEKYSNFLSFPILSTCNEFLRDDIDVVIACVHLNGNNIQYASSKLKNNQNVVITALKSNGISFLKLSLWYINDEQIFNIALENAKFPRQHYLIYEHAGERLKTNRLLTLNIVTKYDCCLSKINSRFLDDEEIVIAALNNKILQDSYKENNLQQITLKFASDRLRDKKHIALLAVKNIPGSLEFVSERLQDDDDVVKESLKLSPQLAFISERLRNQPEIVLPVWNNCLYIQNVLRGNVSASLTDFFTNVGPEIANILTYELFTADEINSTPNILYRKINFINKDDDDIINNTLEKLLQNKELNKKLTNDLGYKKHKI